jgi:glyoxylase-like metal-dependent hydrolase (beta-lactamase superfamily II)
MRDARLPTPQQNASRRAFLRQLTASGAALAFGGSSAVAQAAAAGQDGERRFMQLSEHLAVFQGATNTGILRDGDRALLIDCGDGSLPGILREKGVRQVERILFTHHHRDQACGAYSLAASGTRIGAADEERVLFDDPAAYWKNDGNIWRVYRSFRPHALTLVEPLPVDDALTDDQEIRFGPATIRVLSTPGHTNGSLSYLVRVDGREVVFCGDCLYGDGQLWDVYSLQRGFRRGDRSIGGYHGFMGDQWRLVESLERIAGLQPRQAVPSHGPIVDDPAKAIRTLKGRLAACYENYVSISALRHYFPELFTKYEGRPGQMPIRPGIAPPECLRHFGTTWMLVSKSGAALVMDVGSPGQVDRIQKMLEREEIRRVDALWVTHYHFDHTDGIPRFQQEFDCPCYTDRRLAEVLQNPKAWRLPCLSPEPIRVHRPLEDGASWEWEEYRLTSFVYPGQTLYHAALLAERDDLRMLFVGDSHTMAGNDDYCAYNRNWLGRGAGFQYCLSLVERLRPTHMFNCHVNDAFTFTPEEIRFMRKQLDERETLFGQLVPWEHANFGTDPSWVRCQPYWQQARAGDTLNLRVVFTNHAPQEQAFKCRVAGTRSLGGKPSAWTSISLKSKAEQPVELAFQLARDLPAGRYVLPIDVTCGDRQLPQFTEAIVDLRAR